MASIEAIGLFDNSLRVPVLDKPITKKDPETGEEVVLFDIGDPVIGVVAKLVRGNNESITDATDPLSTPV